MELRKVAILKKNIDMVKVINPIDYIIETEGERYGE